MTGWFVIPLWVVVAVIKDFKIFFLILKLSWLLQLFFKHKKTADRLEHKHKQVSRWGMWVGEVRQDLPAANRVCPKPRCRRLRGPIADALLIPASRVCKCHNALLLVQLFNKKKKKKHHQQQPSRMHNLLLVCYMFVSCGTLICVVTTYYRTD